MKKITLIILLAFTTIIYAQDPIDVVITGECAEVSSTYFYNGLVNGKNNYVQSFVIGGVSLVIGVGFDGTKWVLYANGDITDDGFDNIAVPVGLLPPSIGWVNTGCLDGTMTINQVLNVNENNFKNITLYPNPSTNYITIENTNDTNSTFEYKIYDLTGRIVSLGNSKYNDKIVIESLTIGNYLIQIKEDNGAIFNQKIIKN